MAESFVVFTRAVVRVELLTRKTAGRAHKNGKTELRGAQEARTVGVTRPYTAKPPAPISN
jgi:hypothetical protein